MFKPTNVLSNLGYTINTRLIQDEKKEIPEILLMPISNIYREKIQKDEVKYKPAQRLKEKLYKEQKKNDNKKILQNSINNIINLF